MRAAALTFVNMFDLRTYEKLNSHIGFLLTINLISYARYNLMYAILAYYSYLIIKKWKKENEINIFYNKNQMRYFILWMTNSFILCIWYIIISFFLIKKLIQLILIIFCIYDTKFDQTKCIDQVVIFLWYSDLYITIVFGFFNFLWNM